jgi:hypothetical protein
LTKKGGSDSAPAKEPLLWRFDFDRHLARFGTSYGDGRFNQVTDDLEHRSVTPFVQDAPVF